VENVEKLAAETTGTLRLPITYFAHNATAVRYDGVRALLVLAARDIAAERRRAAGLDRAHHLQLRVGYVAAVGFTPSGAEVAEDVRDFQSGTLHESGRLVPRILGS
jgi:hypothetical protein